MQFHNTKGQIVGELKQGIYRKHVHGSKHLMKNMDAWGIDSAIIDELKDNEAVQIRIKDDENDKIYAIQFPDFLAHSVERDFGYGKQRFVSRKFFTLAEPLNKK